jgi:hypothetical protein
MTSTSGSNDADNSVEQPQSAANTSVAGAEISLQQFVQNIAAITASLYVVGLLTTNAYLYGLGVSDFSLLRARFVLTGLVALLPLSIALIGGLYAADEAATLGGAAGAAQMSRWFVRHVVFPSALFFLLCFFLFWYSADNDPLVAARAAALLSATCAVIVVALLGGLALYQVAGRRLGGNHLPRKRSMVFGQFTRWIGIPDSVVESLVLAIAGPLLVLTYIGWFGQHFYPLIPEQLGGGKSHVVQLLIASDAMPAARELGLSVSQDAPVTPPVELLWHGSETYVIRQSGPGEQAIVQLDSDLVDGIVAVPPDSSPQTVSNSPGSSPQSRAVDTADAYLRRGGGHGRGTGVGQLVVGDDAELA